MNNFLHLWLRFKEFGFDESNEVTPCEESKRSGTTE